jgi:hypothetical protein
MAYTKRDYKRDFPARKSSGIGSALVISLGLILTGVGAAYVARPQVRTVVVPNKGEVQIVRAPHRRATLEQVRQDWHIIGPLRCQAGPR